MMVLKMKSSSSPSSSSSPETKHQQRRFSDGEGQNPGQDDDTDLIGQRNVGPAEGSGNDLDDKIGVNDTGNEPTGRPAPPEQNHSNDLNSLISGLTLDDSIIQQQNQQHYNIGNNNSFKNKADISMFDDSASSFGSLLSNNSNRFAPSPSSTKFKKRTVGTDNTNTSEKQNLRLSSEGKVGLDGSGCDGGGAALKVAERDYKVRQDECLAPPVRHESFRQNVTSVNDVKRADGTDSTTVPSRQSINLSTFFHEIQQPNQYQGEPHDEDEKSKNDASIGEDHEASFHVLQLHHKAPSSWSNGNKRNSTTAALRGTGIGVGVQSSIDPSVDANTTLEDNAAVGSSRPSTIQNRQRSSGTARSSSSSSSSTSSQSHGFRLSREFSEDSLQLSKIDSNAPSNTSINVGRSATGPRGTRTTMMGTHGIHQHHSSHMTHQFEPSLPTFSEAAENKVRRKKDGSSSSGSDSSSSDECDREVTNCRSDEAIATSKKSSDEGVQRTKMKGRRLDVRRKDKDMVESHGSSGYGSSMRPIASSTGDSSDHLQNREGQGQHPHDESVQKKFVMSSITMDSALLMYDSVQMNHNTTSSTNSAEIPTHIHHSETPKKSDGNDHSHDEFKNSEIWEEEMVFGDSTSQVGSRDVHPKRQYQYTPAPSLSSSRQSLGKSSSLESSSISSNSSFVVPPSNSEQRFDSSPTRKQSLRPPQRHFSTDSPSIVGSAHSAGDSSVTVSVASSNQQGRGKNYDDSTHSRSNEGRSDSVHSTKQRMSETPPPLPQRQKSIQDDIAFVPDDSFRSVEPKNLTDAERKNLNVDKSTNVMKSSGVGQSSSSPPVPSRQLTVKELSLSTLPTQASSTATRQSQSAHYGTDFQSSFSTQAIDESSPFTAASTDVATRQSVTIIPGGEPPKMPVRKQSVMK